MSTYSAQRSTAIHEAGHGAMAYLLGRMFTSISVEADSDSEGRVTHAAPGEWFRPDIEINARTRSMIEDHVMICLAGGETEAAWCVRQAAPPDGWQEHIDAGAYQDRSAAIGLAGYVSDGSVPELEAYLEWLRQRVLGWTGRPLAEGENDRHPGVVSRITDGNPRFWPLVTALADAVEDAGTLTWRRAREVLRTADRTAMDEMLSAYSYRARAS